MAMTGSSSSSHDSSSTTHFDAMFEKLKKIGKGGFGSVYLCKHRFDGSTYAVKKVLFNSSENYDQVLREVYIMSKVHHSNIVRYNLSWVENEEIYFSESGDSSLYTESRTTISKDSPPNLLDVDYFQMQGKNGSEDSPPSGSMVDVSQLERKTGSKNSSLPPDRSLFIAMEYLPLSLDKKLEAGPIDPPLSYKIFKQIADAVSYIHHQEIVHRDLSSQNIFLDVDGNAKLGDFGLSVYVHEIDSMRHESLAQGNLSYRAPELLDDPFCLSKKVDVFSLGLIFFEMMIPMSTKAERAQTFDKIRKGEFDWSTLDRSFEKFIRNMLEVLPSERSDIDDIVQHLFLVSSI